MHVCVSVEQENLDTLWLSLAVSKQTHNIQLETEADRDAWVEAIEESTIDRTRGLDDCAHFGGADAFAIPSQPVTRAVLWERVVTFLKTVPLLAGEEGLSESTFQKLALASTAKKFADGAVLAEQGTVVEFLYIVKEGEALCTEEELGEVCTYAMSDTFGEQCITFEDTTSLNTVIAKGEVMCIMIPRVDIQEYLRDQLRSRVILKRGKYLKAEKVKESVNDIDDMFADMMALADDEAPAAEPEKKKAPMKKKAKKKGGGMFACCSTPEPREKRLAEAPAAPAPEPEPEPEA